MLPPDVLFMTLKSFSSSGIRDGPLQRTRTHIGTPVAFVCARRELKRRSFNYEMKIALLLTPAMGFFLGGSILMGQTSPGTPGPGTSTPGSTTPGSTRVHLGRQLRGCRIHRVLLPTPARSPDRPRQPGSSSTTGTPGTSGSGTNGRPAPYCRIGLGHNRQFTVFGIESRHAGHVESKRYWHRNHNNTSLIKSTGRRALSLAPAEPSTRPILQQPASTNWFER